MGRGGEGRASRTSVKAFNFIVYAVTLNIDHLDPLFNVLTLCFHSYAKISSEKNLPLIDRLGLRTNDPLKPGASVLWGKLPAENSRSTSSVSLSISY